MMLPKRGSRVSCTITKTIGLRAKFLRLSVYFAWPISGIPAVRLSGPRSFFHDPGFAQAVDEVLRSGDQGVSANALARNRATVTQSSTLN